MSTRVASVKSFVKAFDEEQGTVDKIVSVFGNVDLGNDRVVYGAFANSLARWEASGDPIPVVFSHQWNSLDAHAGEVLEAKELAPGDPLLPEEIAELGGLWVREQYDLDYGPSKRLFELQKRRRIRESSFAYDVIRERKARDGANELVELDLIEVGPTLKGMNPLTQLLDAKAQEEVRMSGTTAAPATGVKAVVTLDGSYEQLQEQLGEAIREWAPATFPQIEIYTAYLEATYPDHCVVYVESWSDPYGGGSFYAVDYTGDAGGINLSEEPREVTLSGAVQEKHLPDDTAEAKAAGASARKGRYFNPASVRAELDLLEL